MILGICCLPKKLVESQFTDLIVHLTTILSKRQTVPPRCTDVVMTMAWISQNIIYSCRVAESQVSLNHYFYAIFFLYATLQTWYSLPYSYPLKLSYLDDIFIIIFSAVRFYSKTASIQNRQMTKVWRRSNWPTGAFNMDARDSSRNGSNSKRLICI